MRLSITNQSGDLVIAKQGVGKDLWWRESVRFSSWSRLYSETAHSSSDIVFADADICSRLPSRKGIVAMDR
jgi:hypothetical protein